MPQMGTHDQDKLETGGEKTTSMTGGEKTPSKKATNASFQDPATSLKKRQASADAAPRKARQVKLPDVLFRQEFDRLKQNEEDWELWYKSRGRRSYPVDTERINEQAADNVKAMMKRGSSNTSTSSSSKAG